MTGKDHDSIIGKVTEADDAEAQRRLYDNWAASYDSDLAAEGWPAPDRCARALASVADDPAAPLLDLACGTGLSGEAFRDAGFTDIDGIDFSAEMLKVAERKAGVYNRLALADLRDPLPARHGKYRYAAAVGVLKTGNAPADILERVVEILQPGGAFVFTLSDLAIQEDASYEDVIQRLSDAGLVEIAVRDYGDHVTNEDLRSFVICLRKR